MRAQHLPIMLGPNFLPLPVHPGGPLVEHLHAIHPDVALAGLGIARHHARQRDEPSRILRPAFQNRQMIQREIVFANIFLARPARNRLRKELPHLRQHGQHFHFVEKALRRLHIHELPNAVGHFIQRIHFQRHAHPPLGAKLIDEHRNVVPLGILKQQRRPAGVLPSLSACPSKPGR